MCSYLAAMETNSLHTKDLCFADPCNISPLPSDQCQRLLQTYFFKNTKNLSFTILNIFLNFLSNQLIKFSLSQFFTVNNLKAMGANPALRTDLLLALLQVSDEFSRRSAGAAQILQVTSNPPSSFILFTISQASQLRAMSSVDVALSQTEGMIQWAQSNHLLVVFHSQDPNTVSARIPSHTLSFDYHLDICSVQGQKQSPRTCCKAYKRSNRS